MLGRILLTLDSLGLLFGAVIADMNETHQYNPRWPPHAKFHNAQTITLSILLAIATLYLTWRPYLTSSTTSSSRSVKDKPVIACKRCNTDGLAAAAFTGSIYWLAGLVAILFPETAGVDPEFGTGFPQGWLFGGFAVAGLAGAWLEAREAR